MSARDFPPADLRVIITAWEIECCAPPPVVGELTSWRLIFQPVALPDPQSLDRVPGAVSTLQWLVEPWSVDGDRRALYRNGAAAYYHQSTAAGAADAMTAPPPGRHRLRGELFGSRHGGGDDDLFPVVSARVSRIQLISCELRQQGRSATPVPGSTTLTDVRQSPKWFTRHPPGPVVSVPLDSGGQWRRRVVPDGLLYPSETGILLTLRDVGASTRPETNGARPAR